MAVSFNIPKSTKRSKFVVDTFRGVDFTSAGIDVDPTRSPYAPNMIRHTPGKVRKRMGYSKEIQFGTYTNVNLAVGTSAEEREILVNDNNADTWIYIYELIENVTADEGDTFPIYYEFDYKAEEDFYLEHDDIIIPASEEWTHYSGHVDYPTSTYIAIVKIRSSQNQEIFIKNFAAMKAKDSNYKWSLAPKQVKESSGNNYFFGAHAYRSLVKDNKKSYINVNRAMDSREFYIPLEPTYIDLTELEEYVYRNTDNTVKRTLYVEFDYNSTVDFRLSIAGKYNVIPAYIGTVYEPYKHYSYKIKRGSYTNNKIRVRTDSDTGTGSAVIQNLFVGYAKDDNYSWSLAPEDIGQPSVTPDLYWEGKRNFSEITEYYNSWTASWSVYYDQFTVVSSDAEGVDAIKGFSNVEFTLSCDIPSSQHEKTEIYLVNDAGELYYKKTILGDISNLKLSFYEPTDTSDRYIAAIGIRHSYYSEQSRTISNTVTNIKVREIIPRDAYNILSENYMIYHIGNKFWLENHTGNYQEMAPSPSSRRSHSVQFGDYLIILDGKDIYEYSLGQAGVEILDDYSCYKPTITISKKPSGGGTSYEPLNMLTPGFKEQFLVSSEDATTRDFHLSFANLDSRNVRAWILRSNGLWEERKQGTHFSVNRSTGVVTFATAPGVTPISGQDNVRIEAYHTVEGYRDRVTKCKFATIYGENGRPIRLFVSGNPDYPSQDFYSEQNDHTYFPDINYSYLGASAGEITGYAYVGNYLGTFKKEGDNAKSLIIREGVGTTKDDGTYEARFDIVNSLQGEGPVSPFSISYLEGEPLYLSKKGIFAVTTQDNIGNKYGQNRSFYLNGRLEKETGLEEGYCTVFNDMYILALNNHFYILDGLQPAISENDPYSTRQYSGFYCDNIPATCIWNDGDNLYFGTADGKLCKFYTSSDDIASYNDDGYPISAWWETPDLDGYLFYKNKTFRYFAIRLMKAFRTSFKLYAEKYSVWSFIKEDDSTGRAFDFTRIDFDEFSFSTDWSEKLSHTKLRIKKVDKARFKIENSKLYQPFGIYDLALEYIENGNYKR